MLYYVPFNNSAINNNLLLTIRTFSIIVYSMLNIYSKKKKHH